MPHGDGRPATAGGLTETVVLECSTSSPGVARRLVERLCAAAGLSEALVEDAALLVSEVVTNAVVHAMSRPRLTVTAAAAGVGVVVGDDSTDLPLDPAPEPEGAGGRGLRLIEECADAWGWQLLPDRSGKRVWFELHAAPAPAGDIALAAS